MYECSHAIARDDTLDHILGQLGRTRGLTLSICLADLREPIHVVTVVRVVGDSECGGRNIYRAAVEGFVLRTWGLFFSVIVDPFSDYKIRSLGCEIRCLGSQDEGMPESLRKKKGISFIGDTEWLFFHVHTMHLGVRLLFKALLSSPLLTDRSITAHATQLS